MKTYSQDQGRNKLDEERVGVANFYHIYQGVGKHDTCVDILAVLGSIFFRSPGNQDTIFSDTCTGIVTYVQLSYPSSVMPFPPYFTPLTFL